MRVNFCRTVWQNANSPVRPRFHLPNWPRGPMMEVPKESPCSIELCLSPSLPQSLAVRCGAAWGCANVMAKPLGYRSNPQHPLAARPPAVQPGRHRVMLPPLRTGVALSRNPTRCDVREFVVGLLLKAPVSYRHMICVCDCPWSTTLCAC